MSLSAVVISACSVCVRPSLAALFGCVGAGLVPLALFGVADVRLFDFLMGHDKGLAHAAAGPADPQALAGAVPGDGSGPPGGPGAGLWRSVLSFFFRARAHTHTHAHAHAQAGADAQRGWSASVVKALLAAGTLVAAAAVMNRVLDALRAYRKPAARRMSFTSSVMLDGVFPEHVQGAPPIIGCCLYFEPGSAPSVVRLRTVGRELAAFMRFKLPVAKLPLGGDHAFMARSSAAASSEDLEAGRFTSVSVVNEAEMHAYLRETMSKPLKLPHDQSPLWEMHRIECTAPGARSVVLVRIHHVIGDGISLVQAMNEVLRDALGRPIDVTPPFARRLKGFDLASYLQPSRLLQLASAAVAATTMPMSKFDADISFSHPDKQRMKGPRRYATVMMPQVRLDFVKRLKDAASATVNDVLVAATAGMIRRYCLSKNDPAVASGKPLQIRALVPVAFPRTTPGNGDREMMLRNYWCFISSQMPVDKATPRERIAAAAAALSELKNSPVAPIQLFLQNKILPYLPRFLVRQITLDGFSRHTMVFSNVPGPQQLLSFAGSRVIGMQILFPNLIPQTIAISYNGSLFMNVVLDEDIVPNAESILPDMFIDELLAMAQDLGVPVAGRQQIVEATEFAPSVPAGVGAGVAAGASAGAGAGSGAGGAGSSTATDAFDEDRSSLSWKDMAGRSSGAEGYQVGDLSRMALQAASKK